MTFINTNELRENDRNSITEQDRKFDFVKNNFIPRNELDSILFNYRYNSDYIEDGVIFIDEHYFDNILTSYGVPEEYEGGDEYHYGYCRDWFLCHLDEFTCESIYKVSDTIMTARQDFESGK